MIADAELPWDELESKLKSRCEAADLRYERRVTDALFGDADSKTYFTVFLKDGRDERPFSFFGKKNLARLLDQHFEQVRAIAGYAGVRFLGQRRCALFLTPLDRYLDPRKDYRAQFADVLRESGVGDPETASVSVSSPDGATSLTLRLADHVEQLFSPTWGGGLLLAAEGFEIDHSDAAVALVEREMNSFLFQLDHLLPMGFVPIRRFAGSLDERARGRTTGAGLVVPVYPTARHAPEPLSLFWYARQARGTPLLQYLSFYQVIEFFFPRYSDVEAQKRVRNVLLDPLFRASNPRDLARVVTTVHSATRGRSGDERSQLKSTLRESITDDELRAFLTAEERRKFFASPNALRAAAQKLSVESPKSDLLTEVALRIYEIRCRIVHTRDGADSGAALEPLLPFSRDAEFIAQDLNLIDWVASRVIAASSEPL